MVKRILNLILLEEEPSTVSEDLRDESDVCPFLVSREESEVKSIDNVDVLDQYHVHIGFEAWD